MKPGWPFVGDEFIVKAILFRHVRQESLHLRWHIVLDEPHLHMIPAHRSQYSAHHIHELHWKVNLIESWSAHHVFGHSGWGKWDARDIHYIMHLSMLFAILKQRANSVTCWAFAKQKCNCHAKIASSMTNMTVVYLPKNLLDDLQGLESSIWCQTLLDVDKLALFA